MAVKRIMARNITGMNNRLDPTRIPFDYETLSGPVAELTNMRVTEGGEAILDFGYSQLLSGNFHSLFCDGKADCLVGKQKGLYQVLKDGAGVSLRGIRDSLSGLPMAFCRIGDSILYSDTLSMNGIARNGVSDPWPVNKYILDTDRKFSEAPIATCMDKLNGRLYMAPADEPNTILWSERGQVGLYNRAKCFRRFESAINLIAAVSSGLVVSTQERTVFLRIGDDNRPVLEPGFDFPAVRGSLAHRPVQVSMFGLEGKGFCRVWRGEEGPCIVFPTGEMYCLTDDNIYLPPGCSSYGASIVVGSFLYSTAG